MKGMCVSARHKSSGQLHLGEPVESACHLVIPPLQFCRPLLAQVVQVKVKVKLQINCERVLRVISADSSSPRCHKVPADNGAGIYDYNAQAHTHTCSIYPHIHTYQLINLRHNLPTRMHKLQNEDLIAHK